MPVTLSFANSSGSVGIEITYTKSTKKLFIGGWYDGIVGIEGATIDLADFFTKLGISEKDCEMAFRKARTGR